MSKLIFRNLRADEIDVRVQTVNENGCSLLLYKDARCDMNILDETVGPLDWKREHIRENANCIVSIWDKEKQQWVSKEDTGTESMTEKEKGLASDSFKRACFNWGIGRELYTSPFIWVKDREKDKFIYNTGRKDKNGKSIYGVKEKFKVKSIEIKEGIITKLIIIDSKNNISFKYEEGQEIKTPDIENSEEKPKEYKESDVDKKFLDYWNSLSDDKRLKIGEKYPNKFGKPQLNPQYFKKSEKEEILKKVEEAKKSKGA